MLAGTRKTSRGDEGFTLIELLVVIVIIGILAAIAVPTFLNQREKAWARAVQSDLRNAAIQVEEHYSETGSYTGITTDFRESGSVQRVWVNWATDGNFCLLAQSSTLKGSFGQDNSSTWGFSNYGPNAGKPVNTGCGG